VFCCLPVTLSFPNKHRHLEQKKGCCNVCNLHMVYLPRICHRRQVLPISLLQTDGDLLQMFFDIRCHTGEELITDIPYDILCRIAHSFALHGYPARAAYHRTWRGTNLSSSSCSLLTSSWFSRCFSVYSVCVIVPGVCLVLHDSSGSR
jgi:hypothetical protein